MSEARARREITRAFPELRPQQVTFLGSGVDSDAYLIDDAWVFRFPKRPAVSEALAREIALLPRLAERLPVAVPHFEYVGRQAENGLLFVGYRAILGEPLTADLFDALASASQERVLQTVARFLDAVHSFPLAEARVAHVRDLSVHDLVRSAWESAGERALGLLSASEGAALTRMIERFLAGEATLPQEVAAGQDNALLYADFAPEHLLYDLEADNLAGIIDWGDLAIGDPDFDLTYLYQDYGERFVERLLAYLPHPDPAYLFFKLRVFCAWDYLHDLADQDADVDPDDLTEALDGLRSLVRER